MMEALGKGVHSNNNRCNCSSMIVYLYIYICVYVYDLWSRWVRWYDDDMFVIVLSELVSSITARIDIPDGLIQLQFYIIRRYAMIWYGIGFSGFSTTKVLLLLLLLLLLLYGSSACCTLYYHLLTVLGGLVSNGCNSFYGWFNVLIIHRASR